MERSRNLNPKGMCGGDQKQSGKGARNKIRRLAGRQEEEVVQTKKRKERDGGNEVGNKDGQIKVRKTKDREKENMDNIRITADAEEIPEHHMD